MRYVRCWAPTRPVMASEVAPMRIALREVMLRRAWRGGLHRRPDRRAQSMSCVRRIEKSTRRHVELVRGFSSVVRITTITTMVSGRPLWAGPLDPVGASLTVSYAPHPTIIHRRNLTQNPVGIAKVEFLAPVDDRLGFRELALQFLESCVDREVLNTDAKVVNPWLPELEE